MNPGPTATTADNSSSENSVLELPTLIARGNVHQGDTSFSEESRGRQCAFMALTSLAYNQHEMAVSNWQPEALDEILHFGDSQFLDALHRGFIPDAPNLSVEQLPTTVHFATSNEDNKQFLCFFDYLYIKKLEFFTTKHMFQNFCSNSFYLKNLHIV